MSERLNPITLKNIRKLRKVSVDELATWMNVDSERIERFEAGTATPTVVQLEKMSKAFKVPLYAYKGNLIPNLDPLPDDFRKRQPNQADLTPAGLAKLWAVERIADFTNELLIALGDNAPRKLRSPLNKQESLDSPEGLREAVDDWMERYAKVINSEKSLPLTFSKRLRLYIERHGCMISYDDAPSTDYLGFYKKFNQRTPLAFVNRKSGSQKASLFTLAHEWAHYLADAEGVSNPWIASNAIERKCNQFAARFLAPESAVKRIIDGVWFQGISTEQLISDVSRSSLLSFQASAIRLQELGFAKKPDVDSVFRKVLKPSDFDNLADPPPERSGGNVYSAAGRRVAEVGTYACLVASEAVRNRLIDDVDVSAGLNISIKLQPFVFEMARKRFGLDAE